MFKTFLLRVWQQAATIFCLAIIVFWHHRSVFFFLIFILITAVFSVKWWLVSNFAARNTLILFLGHIFLKTKKCIGAWPTASQVLGCNMTPCCIFAQIFLLGKFLCGVFHAYTIAEEDFCLFKRRWKLLRSKFFFHENPAWDAPQIMQRFLSEN